MSFPIKRSTQSSHQAAAAAADVNADVQKKISNEAEKALAAFVMQRTSAARKPLQRVSLGAAADTVNSPEQFFSMFEGYDYSAFTSQDIAHLRELMQSNALGGYVYFADLIALDCMQIIEESRAFMSQESFTNIEEAWLAIVMQWVFGSLRVHLRNDMVQPISEHTFRVFVYGKPFLDILEIFSRSLSKEIDRELERKLSTVKLKSLKARIKADADQKIPKIKAKWENNMSLIQKIMTSSDRGLLFFQKPLQFFQQGQPRLPQNIEQVHVTLKAMQQLWSMYKRGLGLNDQKKGSIRVFSDILQSLEAAQRARPKLMQHAFHELQQHLKDYEVYLECSGQVILSKTQDAARPYDASAASCSLEDYQKKYELCVFETILNYYSELMINKINAQIDVMILPVLEPGHVPRLAWIDRAFAAINSILNADIPIALISATYNVCNDQPDWKTQLSLQRLKYSLNIFQYLELLTYLEKSRHEYGYLRLFFDTGVECFALELNKMISDNLDDLKQCLAQFNPPAEGFIEETTWFTKLLFLQHDLNVLIGKDEAKDEEEILAPYLSLLESLHIGAQAPNPDLEELIEAFNDLDPQLGNVFSKPLPEEGVAAAATQEDEPKIQPTKITKAPKVTLAQEPAPQRVLGKFTEEEAERFKHLKNAKVSLIQKELAKLGLKFLRQKGSHQQWGLEEDKTVRTTLPVHPGRAVHPSILHSIVEQVGVAKSS